MPETTTTATIRADVVFSQQQSFGASASNIVMQGSTDYSVPLNSGSGKEVREIDSIFNVGNFIIASGETESYDLSSLTQSAFGSNYSISLTGLKGLVIRNHATGVNEMLTLKATGANAFTSIFNGGSGGPEGIKISPGGAYFYSDPYWGTPVTASNKILNLTNVGSGSGVNNYNTGLLVSIVIAGTSGTGGY
tara:strand:+ start:65 stop:640 length:576 start_codon:yes stop_codon:yes gene_type:complete